MPRFGLRAVSQRARFVAEVLLGQRSGEGPSHAPLFVTVKSIPGRQTVVLKNMLYCCLRLVKILIGLFSNFSLAGLTKPYVFARFPHENQLVHKRRLQESYELRRKKRLREGKPVSTPHKQVSQSIYTKCESTSIEVINYSLLYRGKGEVTFSR